MSPLTRALALLALAGLVLGALGAAVIAASDYVDHRGLSIAISLGIGAAWIGTGLYAWWRRPANRVGALMTWTGFAWLLNAFVAANAPAVFTIAVLGANLYLAAFAHLLVAYPEGTAKPHRRLLIAAYTLAIVGPAPFLMFGFDAHCTGKGARYTRSRKPVRLLASFELADRSSASRAEYRVKQLTPVQKRELASGARTLASVLPVVVEEEAAAEGEDV